MNSMLCRLIRGSTKLYLRQYRDGTFPAYVPCNDKASVHQTIQTVAEEATGRCAGIVQTVQSSSSLSSQMDVVGSSQEEAATVILACVWKLAHNRD